MPQILASSFIGERNRCLKYLYMAEAYKPDPDAEQADWEWQQIEFELNQLATRDTAQDEVTKRLGDGWTLQISGFLLKKTSSRKHEIRSASLT